MQISQFILYHGSDTNVKLPVWYLGSRYRDFGQCFYTTYDRETAEDWADKMNTRLTLCSRLKPIISWSQDPTFRKKAVSSSVNCWRKS